MAKQTFTAGQVLTAAEMNSLQENDYNWTVTTKTASYTLAAGDEGTRIVMNNAGATTITVDDAVFAAGDVVWLHNIGAGTCTVTAGTATVNTAASLELAQWEGGSLFFTSASSAIFFRGPAAGVGTANFTDTETGTYSSGGTNYKYLTFTSSGTITIDTAGLADILVVGGGGGGGSTAGGGGGAGGHLYATGAYLPVGTLTVTVGAGGAGGIVSGQYTPGQNGSPSRIDDYWGVGGGAGAGNLGGAAGNDYGFIGGSGGAGGGQNGVGGSGVSGLGNDGGDGNATTAIKGGGGGGAGSAGADATASVAGDGGAGLANSITGTSVTRAGGGGGGSQGLTAGTGGSGGGGNGTTDSTTAGAGTANTGSGGGGGGYAGAAAGGIGGAGGSGVVIVRVEV